MNTKLLYVIVSSYNDFYLEQAYLSMFSAKKFNNDCYISLLVDSTTYESFIDSRKKLTQLADEIIIADIEQSLPSHYRSRLLKTGARKYISGDFLFIDSDTIIVKRLDTIDSLTGSMYACIDSHALLAQNPYKRRILHDVKTLGCNLSEEDPYFNSGVLYVKDNEESRQFYNLWESIYIKGKCNGVSMDQPSFCVANLQMGKLIKILPDEWNCELKHGARFLNSAKIIHYLCTNISKDNEKQVFILNESKIFDSIKNNGEIPPSVENCIENPDSGLSHPTTIVAGCDNFILQSFCYALLKKLYTHPILFNSIEKLISELSAFFTKINKWGGVKYSIIIPHHNTPDLLERLLSTIPESEDIEVIIVDDMSENVHIKKINQIKLKYPNFIFLSTRYKGGAGKARNLGLCESTGEYIIFADSDDYFLPSFTNLLDKFKNSSKYDIIFFNVISLESKSGDISNRYKHVNQYFEFYKNHNDDSRLRYLWGEPWGKIVKRKLIIDNNIRFDETPINNDTTFSYLAGYHAEKTAIETDRHYCLTYRTDSVSNTISWNKLDIRLDVFCRKYIFLKNHHLPIFDYMLITPFWDCIKRINLYKFISYMKVLKEYEISYLTLFYRLFVFMNYLIINKIKK